MGEADHGEIGALLAAAAAGDSAAVRRFYTALIAGPLFVPERQQERPLTDSPRYPNDFVNILGVQDRERVVVPVFSDASLIEQWCGVQLRYRSMSGTQLFQLLPDGWWLTINPGAEVEKEISPWEVDLLRGGTASIGALAEELEAERASSTVQLQVPGPDEYAGLREALAVIAPTLPELKHLFLLREVGQRTWLLVGAEVEAGREVAERIGATLQAEANRAQIGAEPVRVLAGGTDDRTMILGLFKRTAPFYTAARGAAPTPSGGGVLSRIRSRLFQRE